MNEDNAPDNNQKPDPADSDAPIEHTHDEQSPVEAIPAEEAEQATGVIGSEIIGSDDFDAIADGNVIAEDSATFHDDHEQYSGFSDGRLAQLKIPPHSAEAEEAVVAALMMNNAVFERVSDKVFASDFYFHRHKVLFEAILHQAEKSEPFDFVTIIAHLRVSNQLTDIGGELFVHELLERNLSSTNAETYAKLVRDKSVLRQLIAAGTDIADLAYHPGTRDIKDVIDISEQSVFRIAEQYDSNTKEGFVVVKQLAARAVKQVKALQESGVALTGKSTGWKDLDTMTSGLQRGDLVILAARPSMGKTAFVLNIAQHFGIGLKERVAIFSLEMPGEHLTLRMLSSLSQVDQTRLKSADLRKEDWSKITSSIGLLKDANIFIDDNGDVSPTDIRSKCRRLVREQGELGLIVVDYLQLMQLRDSSENRVNQVSEISRSLKMIAKEFDCPLIALSQLSREVEKRNPQRPVMSDLRDSGAIEQDADVIFFIYRPAVYAQDDAGKSDPKAEIIIGKQRNGPIGTVNLAFQGKFTRFVDYKPEHDVPFD